jgi:hypothetical protein
MAHCAAQGVDACMGFLGVDWPARAPGKGNIQGMLDASRAFH